jgi:hypothetical protein
VASTTVLILGAARGLKCKQTQYEPTIYACGIKLHEHGHQINHASCLFHDMIGMRTNMATGTIKGLCVKQASQARSAESSPASGHQQAHATTTHNQM